MIFLVLASIPLAKVKKFQTLAKKYAFLIQKIQCNPEKASSEPKLTLRTRNFEKLTLTSSNFRFSGSNYLARPPAPHPTPSPPSPSGVGGGAVCLYVCVISGKSKEKQ